MKFEYTDESNNTVKMTREGNTPLFIPRGHPFWVLKGVQAAEDANQIALCAQRPE